MKNLIMADLKVLGNRLWSVPLIAFTLVLGVSLIPNVNMPDAVRNFMIALLAPCLLISELLREELKRNSDSMIMTMPIGKSAYVYGKYITVVILSLTAIPAAWLTKIIMMFVQGTEFTFIESVSFFPGLIKSTMPIILFIYFFLPIYFYTKQLITSIISSLLIFWASSFGLMTVIYEYFYSHFFDNDITNFIYSFLIVIGTAVIIHLIIKFFFRSVPDEWIKTGWFAVILFLCIISFDILMNNLDSIRIYFRLMNKLDTATGPDKEKYLNRVSSKSIFKNIG